MQFSMNFRTEIQTTRFDPAPSGKRKKDVVLVQFEILDWVGLLDTGNVGALARKAVIGTLKYCKP